jgi:PAS domain S-box-containing protein
MPDMDRSGAQKAAEAEVEGFRKALGPFVTAAETTRMPMMFTDAKAPGHRIVFVNQAFLKLTGYDEHEVMGQSFDFLMERGTDPEMLAEIQTAFEGGRDLDPLVLYRRKDATGVWVRIFITPVRSNEGEILQHFASFVDVTEHKEEEDRLRRLLGNLGFLTAD